MLFWCTDIFTQLSPFPSLNLFSISNSGFCLYRNTVYTRTLPLFSGMHKMSFWLCDIRQDLVDHWVFKKKKTMWCKNCDPGNLVINSLISCFSPEHEWVWLFSQWESISTCCSSNSLYAHKLYATKWSSVHITLQLGTSELWMRLLWVSTFDKWLMWRSTVPGQAD